MMMTKLIKILIPLLMLLHLQILISGARRWSTFKHVSNFFYIKLNIIVHISGKMYSFCV